MLISKSLKDEEVQNILMYSIVPQCLLKDTVWHILCFHRRTFLSLYMLCILIISSYILLYMAYHNNFMEITKALIFKVRPCKETETT